MGGVADFVGDVVSAPANIVGSVLGQVPVVGPVLGPAASIAMGGNPFTAVAGGLYNASNGGFSSGGGGGGSSSGSPTPTYIAPGYNYGANTYSYGDKPYDTSKYFIEGNKGVYNVLPQLGNLYGDNAIQNRAGAPSANVYNDILTNIRMNQDPLAEQNFQKAFGLQSYNPNTMTTKLPSDYNAPSYVKSDIQNALNEYYPQGKGSGVVPVNYADFGFGADDTLSKIAQYAKAQKNPFFVPYAPQDVKQNVFGPQPIMPQPSVPPPGPTRYTPVESNRGPAPRDITPASVATGSSFTPSEPGSQTAGVASAPQQQGVFKPVNIRTGGLASLRRT